MKGYDRHDPLIAAKMTEQWTELSKRTVQPDLARVLANAECVGALIVGAVFDHAEAEPGTKRWCEAGDRGAERVLGHCIPLGNGRRRRHVECGGFASAVAAEAHKRRTDGHAPEPIPESALLVVSFERDTQTDEHVL